MKKINSLIISLLCLFAFNANAQQTDSYPKGRYDEIKVDTKNYESTRSVYSADANKLASDWAYNGFSLQAQKGIPVFETGKYQLNAQLSAVSPDITLPAIQNGKLILSLDASFETEFRYDWIRITVKADGKETLVYNKTGSAGRAVDNTIDLTKFAGKTIQLQLYLSADDTKQGKGWTIYHLDIFSTGSIISTLRRGGGTASDIDDIEIISVKSDGFPDEIIVEFTVKDQDSEFISGLELADFTFLDNLLGNIACQNLREPSPVNQVRC